MAMIDHNWSGKPMLDHTFTTLPLEAQALSYWKNLRMPPSSRPLFCPRWRLDSDEADALVAAEAAAEVAVEAAAEAVSFESGFMS